MKALLYKEFRIGIHPLFHLMSLTGALLLIPTWPYFIAMMYCFFITIPNVFTMAKAQNDVSFSVMLPVAKRSVVSARIVSIAVLELEYILVGAFAALIRPALYTSGNIFLDPNFAFFGFSLFMFGLYNVIFFPMFYKTAYKVLLPSLAAMAAALVFAVAVEAVNLIFPYVNAVLEGTKETGAQLLILAGGFASFLLLTLFAFRTSAKRFDLLDL